MGVYSIVESTQLNLGEVGTVDVGTSFMMEACEIIIESNENHNAIMKAIGVAELRSFEENGTEMIYEAGEIKALFGKFVEFFKKMLEKIGMLFKKFFALFNQFLINDKEFVKKYEKTLIATDVKGMEYKGFKYTPEYSSETVDKALAKIGAAKADALSSKSDTDEVVVKTAGLGEDEETNKEVLRGTAAGVSDSLSQKEFTQKLYEKFRSGESTKDIIKVGAIKTYMDYLTGSAKTVAAAKKQYTDAEKEIKAIITVCQKAEAEYAKGVAKDSNKSGKTLKAMTVSINFAKDYLSYVTMANGASLQAFKDQSRQAKAICVKTINYKVNESAGVGSKFLEGVILK